MADLRRDLALLNPDRKLLPGRLHDFALLRQIRQPEALHAGGFGIQGAQVESWLITGRRSVLNDAAEVAQAARALGGVLAAQHFEDRVDAFSVSEVLHGLFIVMLLVVDGVLQ